MNKQTNKYIHTYAHTNIHKQTSQELRTRLIKQYHTRGSAVVLNIITGVVRLQGQGSRLQIVLILLLGKTDYDLFVKLIIYLVLPAQIVLQLDWFRTVANQHNRGALYFTFFAYFCPSRKTIQKNVHLFGAVCYKVIQQQQLVIRTPVKLSDT